MRNVINRKGTWYHIAASQSSWRLAVYTSADCLTSSRLTPWPSAHCLWPVLPSLFFPLAHYGYWPTFWFGAWFWPCPCICLFSWGYSQVLWSNNPHFRHAPMALQYSLRCATGGTILDLIPCCNKVLVGSIIFGSLNWTMSLSIRTGISLSWTSHLLLPIALSVPNLLTDIGLLY